MIIFNNYCEPAASAYSSLDKSPFGVDIHHWNTRSNAYDDGINDGMTNSKIFELIPEMGARWVSDYGESEGGDYYWPETIGFDYMDDYERTLRYFGINAIHTTLGFGADPWSSRGLPPDDWDKYFGLIKEVATRYKDTMRFYKVWHETDNTDGRRWMGTCKEYVRVLKYAHDAIKSVDPDIIVEMSDLAFADGTSTEWNNGDFYYPDGTSDYIEEDAFEKILYEITNNGNDSVYDTSSLGGFPASTNPRAYFDGIGFNDYPQNPGELSHYDSIINYLYSNLQQYGLEREIPIQLHETGLLIWGVGGLSEEELASKRDDQAVLCLSAYRHLLRTGKVTKVFHFHYDPMTYSDETLFASMIDYDVDDDWVNDTEITKYPVWYAYKKMTHLVHPRFEEFQQDEFLENGGTKFYNTGWTMENFSTWTVSNSEFTGQTGSNASMVFKDLVLPTWSWERFWETYGLNRYFIVKMKSNADSTATLHWDNVSAMSAQCDFSNTDNSESFPIAGDGQYHIYTVDLSQNSYWNGIVSAVKFKPANMAGANISIDYFGFTDPGDPARLSLKATPPAVLADGISTSKIEAIVYDQNDLPVVTSTAVITFSLSGVGGSLEGTNPVQAVEGIATITYRAGTTTGTVTITATSPGLTEGSLNIMLTIENTPPNAPNNLLCNDEINPNNITDTTPKLSWTFNDENPDDKQFAYRLLVGDTLVAINNNNGNMWDTNKVTSSLSTATYAGTTLQMGVTYYWKVMTWDSFDTSGPYSTLATFTMGTEIVYNSPVISVSNSILEFGELELGQTKKSTFEIVNIGTDTLIGTITTDKKWIIVEPISFSSNSVTVNVTVDNNILNQKEGEHSGTVSITSNGGKASVEVTLKATCVLTKPNPYDPTKGPLAFFGDGIVPGETTINIYTLSGELVKKLTNVEASLEANKSSKEKEISWDGTNEEGKLVVNGIYIYTYESPNEQGVGKFTVINK